MNALEAEIDRMKSLGAGIGQIEHHLISLGVRDAEEPSADCRWWWLHREKNPACCGPNYPDGWPPRQLPHDSLPVSEANDG